MGIKILINVGSENYSTSNKRFRQREVGIIISTTVLLVQTVLSHNIGKVVNLKLPK